MKRLLLFACLLLAMALPASAQNLTTTSATVVDSAGTAYTFGTYTVNLVNNSGQPALLGGNTNFQKTYQGGLDTNGFFSLALPSVSVMTPGGMQWSFYICANPQVIAYLFPKPVLPCFTYTSTGTQISGSSVDLSASMTAVAAIVPKNFSKINNFIYVDGTTYTTIPQAIAAASSGQTIYVPCGTYAPFTVSTANITLQGEGKCSIITGTLAQSLQLSQPNCIIPQACQIVYINAANVTLKGFQIQGQAPDGTTAQSCIEIASNISGSDIEGNYLSGNNGSNGCNRGVYIDPNASSFYVANNEMRQIVGTGSGAGYGIVTQAAGPGILFANKNYFPTGTGRHCLYIGQNSAHVIADGNYCFGGVNDCIELFATDAQPTDVHNEIIANHCDGTAATTGNAIIAIINNENDVNVIGNTITPAATSTVAGIMIGDNGSSSTKTPTNITVDSNLLIGGAASSNCITIQGTSGNDIKNNKCSGWGNAGASQAINIQSDNPNTANNNTISNNTVVGATAQRYALAILGTAPAPTNNIVQGNTLGAGTNGVISEGGTGTIWQGNTIQDTIVHISTPSSSIWGHNVINGISTFGDPTRTSTVTNFVSGPFVASVAGGTDIGSAALPFGNLWLGTAATNNFKFQPAATSAARTIVIPDFGVSTGTMTFKEFAQTWTAAQTHNSGNLILAGATSGTTILNANATAGSTTATLPANTGIVSELNLSQSWTATQTFAAGSGNADIKVNNAMVAGNAPTCSSTGSTSPTCTVTTGSTNTAGTIQITVGTSPAALGTVTLTFSGNFGTNPPVCIMVPSQLAAGQWNARATIFDKTPAIGSDLQNWDNNAAALTASTAIDINYHCWAK